MSSDQVDYEKQYQADLERAAALSMETLALDEFKRKQRNGLTSQRNSITTSQIRSHPTSRQQPQIEQRRRSEIIPPTSAPDLMSFNVPEQSVVDVVQAPVPPPVDKHSTFVQYVDQIHQMAAQQKTIMGGSSQYPRPFYPNLAGAGMQLMPYVGPGSSGTQPQKQPLTPDQLQKLYDSPYAQYCSSTNSMYSAAPNYWHLSANNPGQHLQQQQHVRSASVPTQYPTGLFDQFEFGI